MGMIAPISSATSDAHPSPEQLEAFGQGRLLADWEIEAIERHLAACDDCVAAVHRVPADELLLLVTDRESPVGRGDGPRLRAVAGYEVLEELGRGGAGVVYRARQPGLGRIVALKRLHAGVTADREQLARFRREAEALARLRHPNIVQVYDVGEQDGHPYVALEYVDGGSLRDLLARSPLEPADAAELVATLADAVEFAHRHGIVHRDLKPANILLQGGDSPRGRSSDSTRVEGGQRLTHAHAAAPAGAGFGLPKIADFGQAKLLEADLEQTRSGLVIGTPAYMAPEQAAGGAGAAEPPVDIYALGVVLYESLTGRPPFRAATAHETLDQVRSRDPAPPRQLQPGLPRDLEVICLAALRKSPAQRYGSAAALSADLRRFLAGEPIAARGASRRERVGRWVRRRPVLAAWLLAGALAVVAGAAGIAAHEHRLRREAERADANYREARQTVQRLVGVVGGAQFAGTARELQVRRQLLEVALPFYENVLARYPPYDPASRLDRFEALRELATLEVQLGMSEPAERRLEQALALLDEVPPRDATDRQFLDGQRSDCLNKLGALSATRGDLKQARRFYEDASALRERLLALHPEDFAAQAAFAESQLNLGTLDHVAGQLAAAEARYLRALELRRRAWQAHPDREDAGVALAEVHANLAGIWMSTQPARATAACEQAVALLGPVAAERPADPRPTTSLAVAWFNWGHALQSQGEFDGALAKFDAAVRALDDVLRVEPSWVAARSHLHAAHGARALLLETLGRHSAALADWDRAIALAASEAEQDRCRMYRILSLTRTPAYAAAAAEALELAERADRAPADRYNLACVLALSSAGAAADTRLAPEERDGRVEQYAAAAVGQLVRVAGSGFFSDPPNRLQLDSDADLACLRARRDFLEFIAGLPTDGARGPTTE